MATKIRKADIPHIINMAELNVHGIDNESLRVWLWHPIFEVRVIAAKEIGKRRAQGRWAVVAERD